MSKLNLGFLTEGGQEESLVDAFFAALESGSSSASIAKLPTFVNNQLPNNEGSQRACTQDVANALRHPYSSSSVGSDQLWEDVSTSSHGDSQTYKPSIRSSSRNLSSGSSTLTRNNVSLTAYDTSNVEQEDIVPSCEQLLSQSDEGRRWSSASVRFVTRFLHKKKPPDLVSTRGNSIWSKGTQPLRTKLSLMKLRDRIKSLSRDDDDLKAMVQVVNKDYGGDKTLFALDVVERFETSLDFMDLLGLSSLAGLKYIMDCLQAHLDCSPNHRGSERLLRKLVELTGELPAVILCRNVRRVGDNPIAGGGFSDVWKGDVNGKEVSIKVLRVFDITNAENVELKKEWFKEILTWRRLNHRNVLPFTGVNMDLFKPRLALISPWMSNGHLLAYLKLRPASNRVRLLLEVSCGLAYLHSIKPTVIHGDLRARNVLIDDEGCAKICDFGLVRIEDSLTLGTGTSFSGAGSLRWQAPELLCPHEFSESACKITTQSDVYSFACLSHEVFAGEPPFASLHDPLVITAVGLRSKLPSRPSVFRDDNDTLLGTVWDLMCACWSRDPQSRPSIFDIKDQIQEIEKVNTHLELELPPHRPAVDLWPSTIPPTSPQLEEDPWIEFPFVPQGLIHGTPLKDNFDKQEIEFYASISGASDWGISLHDALSPGSRRVHLQNRDDIIFTQQGLGISVSVNWDGYRPWRTLMRIDESKSPPIPVTREKLAYILAKAVVRFVDEHKDGPLAPPADPLWAVGPGRITIDDLLLVSVCKVSLNAWQPKLRLNRPLEV